MIRVSLEVRESKDPTRQTNCNLSPIGVCGLLHPGKQDISGILAGTCLGAPRPLCRPEGVKQQMEGTSFSVDLLLINICYFTIQNILRFRILYDLE